jgi:hypothetical protein
VALVFYQWYARRFITYTLVININMSSDAEKYLNWPVKKLKAELVERGASTSGRKTQLIERFNYSF